MTGTGTRRYLRQQIKERLTVEFCACSICNAELISADVFIGWSPIRSADVVLDPGAVIGSPGFSGSLMYAAYVQPSRVANRFPVQVASTTAFGIDYLPSSSVRMRFSQAWPLSAAEHFRRVTEVRLVRRRRTSHHFLRILPGPPPSPGAYGFASASGSRGASNGAVDPRIAAALPFFHTLTAGLPIRYDPTSSRHRIMRPYSISVRSFHFRLLTECYSLSFIVYRLAAARGFLLLSSQPPPRVGTPHALSGTAESVRLFLLHPLSRSRGSGSCAPRIGMCAFPSLSTFTERSGVAALDRRRSQGLVRIPDRLCLPTYLPYLKTTGLHDGRCRGVQRDASLLLSRHHT